MCVSVSVCNFPFLRLQNHFLIETQTCVVVAYFLCNIIHHLFRGICSFLAFIFPFYFKCVLKCVMLLVMDDLLLFSLRDLNIISCCILSDKAQSV
jgi:hypothetical protein